MIFQKISAICKGKVVESLKQEAMNLIVIHFTDGTKLEIHGDIEEKLPSIVCLPILPD